MTEFTIDPQWRTPDVVAICVGMRESQDFSGLPILADALQDAGCPEGEAVLSALRTVIGSDEASRLTAIVLSAETAEAVQWIDDFAGAHDGSESQESHARKWTYADFIKAAQRYAEYGEWITGGTELEGARVPDEFWEKYQLATGRSILEEKRGNFFSCSC